MYKQLLVYIFICILSVSMVFGNSIDTIKPESAVHSVFMESDAKLDYVNINSYVVMENKFITIDNGNEICDDISQKLGMKEVKIERESKKDFTQINLKGLIDDGVYGTIILQSSGLWDFKESSIVIDIIKTREEYDLEELCGKIRRILDNYGEARLNINIIGYYDGFLGNKQLKEKINNLFNTIGAREIEGIEESDLISITGYTPEISEYISYCGKKVNINIATRFNSYENRTYIWIGTPLIVLEY